MKSQANHQPTQLRQVSIQSREEQGPRLGGAKGDLVAGAQAAGGDPGDEWRLLLEKYGKKDAKSEEKIDQTLVINSLC